MTAPSDHNVGVLIPKRVTPIAAPLVGRIELDRRRVLKDGRAKLKLSLLGVVVEKCGICLSQFKDGEVAALGPDCQHSSVLIVLRGALLSEVLIFVL